MGKKRNNNAILFCFQPGQGKVNIHGDAPGIIEEENENFFGFERMYDGTQALPTT